MLFSSPLFLYLFLPLTLLGYYISPKSIKNYWLLLTSLVFFAWGGISFTLILLISIVLNYIFGLQIQKHLGSTRGYPWAFAGIATNILLLGVFKYANFFIQNINSLFGALSLPLIRQTHIVLPIGISFYTFHSLSYLVDIYKGKTKAQRNIFDLSLYICMFSQLIAGPIIRYSDVWQQLRERTHTAEKFSSGIERFLIGLGKKVLLANTFARVADGMFTSDLHDLSAFNAWLGIICYSLQIYFDFAGYSDMAIGLGRMFGFEFMENFDYPYIAKSVKEFWRRWHISLSSFFRDYVYIALGGNRVAVSRTYINLLIVFFLTGFWHGASWNFVVWGLFHGVFMVFERLGFENTLKKLWQPLSNLYTLIVVMFAWVLFRSETLATSVDYWKAMFNFQTSNYQIGLFLDYMNIEFYTALLVALLGAFGFFRLVGRQVDRWLKSEHQLATAFSYTFHLSSALFYAAILIVCSMYLIVGTYNPFIYYRF